MLREFFIWLFSGDKPFEITVFSFWHILYTLIIFGLTFALGAYLSKRDEKTADKVLSMLATATVIIYIADFFIQPLMHGDASVSGEMNVDKLPFHICTLMCPVLALVQFNKRFAPIREPAAFLAIVGPLMYLSYPSGAFNESSPLSYKVIQTFVYHGLVFSWGVNSIASKKVIPCIKNCYKSLIGLALISIWAWIGNSIYSSPEHSYDWFFITGSSFSYAFPEAMHPYLCYVMPFVVIFAIFAVILCIYGIYYAITAISKRYDDKNLKKA